MKKILFIGHEASRTGAPLILLEIVKYLHTTKKFNQTILLMDSGELTEEFEKYCDVIYWPQPKQIIGLKQIIINRVKDKIRKKKDIVQEFINRLADKKFDVIYSNTIVNGFEVMELKKRLSCPVILHVHEMTQLIETYKPNLSIEGLQTATLIIAASEAVKKNLVENYHVETGKISTVHSFMIHDVEKHNFDNNSIKSKLDLPENSFVILSCGTPQFIKGTDLFFQIANITLKKEPNNLYFVWLGGKENNEDYRHLHNDISRTDLEHKIKLISQVNNPLDYINSCDIFLMCSREDSFPLVCLEAAFLKKPIICFENAGGTSEIVQPEGGIIVPYLDILCISDAILDLQNNPLKLSKLSKSVYQNSQKFTKNLMLPIIEEAILNTINNRNN